ncbi:hypothetical protein HY732_00025 [Candidatus Uhrbacteria bacterium]|nr:hypothetical protein [Candidatus Uhrbacteria bacterium]
MKLGTLDIVSVGEHLDLVAEPVREMLLSGALSFDEIGVASIDPSYSDTATFCEHYHVEPDVCVNCVIVKAERGDRQWYAACAIPATMRADVNGVVRRHLGARRVSFASMDDALRETRMEYGGISQIGLPQDWPLLIESTVASLPKILIGAGVRSSKLILPGRLLKVLPNAILLEHLGKKSVESKER